MRGLNKKVLITGGAQRIGKALCLALAESGCDIAIHYNSSRTEAEKLTAQVQQLGRLAVPLQADLQDASACQTLIDRASRALKGLDVLINNAAVFYQQDLKNTNPADLKRTLQVNLTAPLLLTQFFARQTKTGQIINLLDRRVMSNCFQTLAYTLSKQALKNLTEMAALELAPGITVNAIAPGAVLSPANTDAREPAGLIPLQRRPGLDDIVSTLLFLLNSKTLTGQVIFVDGGQHLLN